MHGGSLMSESPSIPHPNFTQIPNVIFDYWWSRLTSSEAKIVGIMCRKIYGWHKTSDCISLTQLENTTGMTRKTILKAIDGLMDHGLILKAKYSDEYGNQSNEYRFNVEKPEDEIYQKKQRPMGEFTQGSGKIPLGVVEKFHQGGSGKIPPTKERPNTKEKEIKKHGVGRISQMGENGNCLLTESDKTKLLEKMSAQEFDYWIEEIDIAVGQAGGHTAFNKKYKINTDTHYFTILSWKRKREAEGKPIGKQTGSPQSNAEYANYVKENFEAMAQQRHIRIEVSPSYIEFIRLGSQAPSICLNYTEKGFKVQVEGILRKLGIMNG